MSDEITVTDDRDAARYEITLNGVTAGFATYRLKPGAITFLHTEIDPELEGRGLAGKLVGHALDDARARNLAVRPVCSYVAGYIERHPEYADLVTR